MEWVETTGRTIEEAKEAALDELGVDETEAEFEILEQPRVGLFGRLRSEGRVRARVRPTAPRPKEDRRDRRTRRRTEAASRGGDTQAEAASGSGARVDARTVEAGRGESATSTTTATADVGSTATARSGETGPDEPVGEDDDASASGSGRRRSRRRRGSSHRSTAGPAPQDDHDGGDPEAVESGRQAGGDEARIANASASGIRRRGRPAPQDHAPARTAHGDDDHQREGTDVEVALEEQARVAEGFLAQLVAELGMEAAVHVARPDEDTVDLQLTGQDLGLLIGQRGATLLALQDLTRTVVQRRTGASNGRIHVDVSGYRQRRAEALARFAQQIATTVRESGTPTTLEPMSAADRKVVHDAINDMEGVSTVSEGEEPRRYVVVVPAQD